MTEDKERTDEFAQAFGQIAEHLNELPPEQRAAFRAQLGEYAHDFKHVLGLVLGANAVLQRDEEVVRTQGDMLEVIEDAAKQLDALFELFVHNLPNQIDLDE